MTYSIVAFDSASGQFGVAVASCVPIDVVRRVPGEVPGRGAFVTQALLFDEAHVVATERLEKGASAETTLAAMIDPTFDPAFQQRQYAVIDADGGVAAFTGEEAQPFAGHHTKRFGSYVYTLQGNILSRDATLVNMEAGFVSDVCDLPARLMRALETAAFDGGGDSRCTPFGHPAKSAAIRVPSVGLSLDADVGSERVNPTPRLGGQFEAWRKEHPCPTSGALTNTRDDGCRVGSCASPTLEICVALSVVALAVLRRRAARSRVP